jgi:CheY-like chemotaxis protein
MYARITSSERESNHASVLEPRFSAYVVKWLHTMAVLLGMMLGAKSAKWPRTTKAALMSVIDFQPKPHPGAKRRVLVVDDDLDTVHSMAMLLRDSGHDVQFAINGFAALQIAREFRPQVIILDIRLPDFRGDDIARQLKWEPGLEGVRMIAISGEGGDEIRQRALAAGFEELHVKPVHPDVLESIVST